MEDFSLLPETKPFNPPPLEEKYQKMLSELDSYQIKVVTAPENESMHCTAGPGAGKTRSIIARAIHLVHICKVPPAKIVLITFTNKAARELKERYLKFFEDQYPQDTPIPTPHISTIHSFCLSQIRRTFGYPATILSEYQSFKLFKESCQKISLRIEGRQLETKEMNLLFRKQQQMIASLDILYVLLPLFTKKALDKVVNIGTANPNNFPFAKLLVNMPYERVLGNLTGKSNRCGFSPQQISQYLVGTSLCPNTWIAILQEYLTEKYKNNVLDFSDMDFTYLMLMLQHPDLRERIHNRFQHISCDEAQDLSNSQYLANVFSDRESFEAYQSLILKGGSK